MDKSLEKVKKSLDVFKKIHTENSRKYPRHSPSYRDYWEISPTGEYKEEYNLAFKEIKEILDKISKSDEEKSFITYLAGRTVYALGEIGREDLRWKKHVNIIKDSNNYLKYFDNLKKGSGKIEGSYSTVFETFKLDAFCSSVISEFVDIIDIKNVKLDSGSPYLDEEEEKDFGEIENLWWEKNYNRVFYDCRALLVKHINKYLGREIKDKIDDIEEFLQKLVSNQEFPKLLEDSLNEILYQFKIMRDILGKGEGETKKNKEHLNSFSLLEEKKKKLSTRITIDLMKVVHNILIILEKENK